MPGRKRLAAAQLLAVPERLASEAELESAVEALLFPLAARPQVAEGSQELWSQLPTSPRGRSVAEQRLAGTWGLSRRSMTAKTQVVSLSD